MFSQNHRNRSIDLLSLLVTAMAAQASSKVKTFTIRFPDYPDYDETEHARLIAQHFSTEHTELVAEPATLETPAETGMAI